MMIAVVRLSLHISWVSESITMSSQINKGVNCVGMFSLRAARVMHSFSLEN